MLAFIEATLLADISAASTLWPRDAAARENRPCPAPTSTRICHHTPGSGLAVQAPVVRRTQQNAHQPEEQHVTQQLDMQLCSTPCASPACAQECKAGCGAHGACQPNLAGRAPDRCCFSSSCYTALQERRTRRNKLTHTAGRHSSWSIKSYLALQPQAGKHCCGHGTLTRSLGWLPSPPISTSSTLGFLWGTREGCQVPKLVSALLTSSPAWRSPWSTRLTSIVKGGWEDTETGYSCGTSRSGLTVATSPSLQHPLLLERVLAPRHAQPASAEAKMGCSPACKAFVVHGQAVRKQCEGAEQGLCCRSGTAYRYHEVCER